MVTKKFIQELLHIENTGASTEIHRVQKTAIEYSESVTKFMGNIKPLILITNSFSGRTFKKVGTRLLVKREKLKVKRGLQNRKIFEGLNIDNQQFKYLQGVKSVNPGFLRKCDTNY